MDFAKYCRYMFLVASILSIIFLQQQNRLYANNISKYPELSDKVLVENSYRNKIFSYTGEIERVFKNKYGITTIYFSNQNFTNKITGSIFPSFGVIDDNVLSIGNKIKIVGTIKQYKDIYQISPLDKKSIILISKADFCANTIRASEIRNNMDKKINLSNVKIIDSTEFKSKKGKIHLRLKVLVDNMAFDGIIWDSDYDDNVKKFLKNKNQLLCVNAKVGQYKGNISLNIIRISNHK